MSGRYERELSVFADLEDLVSRESRELMLRIDRRVVNETPVDTGSAKRNWIACVNQSPSNVITVPDGADANVEQLRAIEQGATAISGARGFDTIYINNNLPYIERLNNGYSEQQSARYIERIIEQEVAR